MQTRYAGSGEWQSGVGDIGLGFVPFWPPGLPLPHFSQVLWSLFSLCLYPPLFSYAVGVLYQIPGGERRGEVSPLYLFLLLSSLLQLHSLPLGFSAPTQFGLPASFPLPADVAGPLSHLSLQAAGQVGRSQP